MSSSGVIGFHRPVFPSDESYSWSRQLSSAAYLPVCSDEYGPEPRFAMGPKLFDGVDPVGVVQVRTDALGDVVEHRDDLAGVVDGAVRVVDLAVRQLDRVLGVGRDLAGCGLVDVGAVLPVRRCGRTRSARGSARGEDALVGVGLHAGLLHLLRLVERRRCCRPRAACSGMPA